MQIDWFSQTGSERTNNCDAGCYGVTDRSIILAIVDAAESEKAQEFSKYWAEILVQAGSNFGYLKDADGVIGELANAQSGLRHRFLHAIASYALAVIHIPTGEGLLFSAGDCLVGTSADNSVDLGGVNWLNSPHTADRQMSEMDETPPSPASGVEHVLTRCINAKRFATPDSTSFSISEGQNLILATDGCWREPPEQANCQKSDDSSTLRLTWTVGDLNVHQESDTENLGTYKGTSNA